MISKTYRQSLKRSDSTKIDNFATTTRRVLKMEKRLFIETYGCQMNVADSEVIASIMKMAGYIPVGISMKPMQYS